MAVLVEGISVIVKRKSIDAHYPGGWEGFVEDAPNRTLCADADLARVGFMAPGDVKHFIERLERRGLKFSDGKQAVDLAVVDQLRGPTTNCPWVEWGRVKLDEGTVSACQMAGGKDPQVACPVAWKFVGSLSEKFTYVPNEDMDRSMKFLRRENGIDVFEDLATGKEVFMGRTTGERT
jgi:hypothetical protein